MREHFDKEVHEMIEKGDPAPDFSMPSDAGGRVSLSDFAGRRLVLYFYPKDDTPGCTKQALRPP